MNWILIYDIVVIISLLYSNATCAPTRKNETRSARIVKNITVYAFGEENSLESDGMSQSLKLNVSWMPPDEGRQPSSYRCTI